MTEIYGIKIMHPVEHLCALQRDDDIVGSGCTVVRLQQLGHGLIILKTVK